MTSDSFEWVERIQDAILSLEEKPQFGLLSEFPLKSFASELNKKLGKNSLNLEINEMRWLLKEEVLEGLGNNPEFSAIGFSPLQPAIIWAMSEENIKTLLAGFLEIEDEKTILLEEEIYKAFYQFILLEAIELFDQTNYAQDLTPHILNFDKQILKDAIDHSFRIDISIQLAGRNAWGFIIIPDIFRTDWKRHFSIKESKHLEANIAKKITLDVALEVGNTQVSLKEWQQVEAGDFLLLDQCYYDPENKSGRLILKVNGHAIFRGKIKEDGIKILEYPLYEMKGGLMDREFEEDDLFGDLEDLEDEEEDLEEDEEEEKEESIDQSISEEEESKKEQDEESKEQGYLSPENIPLQINVEVGRVRMTALELMNLQPGNLLEINAAPERGVDLILNGKKIGRGELIKIGEVLGVRILKL